MKTMARMRTIPKAYEIIKEIDPDTGLTLKNLRSMVNKGEIPIVKIASKRLIDVDLLIKKLSCYNDTATYV